MLTLLAHTDERALLRVLRAACRTSHEGAGAKGFFCCRARQAAHFLVSAFDSAHSSIDLKCIWPTRPSMSLR